MGCILVGAEPLHLLEHQPPLRMEVLRITLPAWLCFQRLRIQEDLPSSRGNLNQHGCLLARHEDSSPCTQMPSFASHLWDRGNPLSPYPALAGCNSPSSLAKWRGKVQQGVRCCCIFLAEEDALCKGCSLPACTHLLKEQLLAHSGRALLRAASCWSFCRGVGELTAAAARRAAWERVGA